MQPSPINEEVEEEVTTSLSKPEEILMAWHLKLAHIPFKTLQNMAKMGHLPKNLTHCAPPKCQACMFGKATKVPWRVKGQTKHIQPTSTPGECVSVDQMESTCPGIIAQLKGIPTKHRYRHVTVFVDHYTRYT